MFEIPLETSDPEQAAIEARSEFVAATNGYLAMLDEWHANRAKDDVRAEAAFVLAERNLREADERVRSAQRKLHAQWRGAH